MKHISELTNVACLTTAREEKKESSALDPLCAQLVDQVFIKFALLCREYDAMYADKRRENAEKLQWTLAFTKHNLRLKSQIQDALDQTELHKWGKPPQLGQFLEWCKPSFRKLGLLDKHQAYDLAIKINRQFADPVKMSESQELVLRRAISQTGSFTLRNLPESKTRPVFERNYEITVNQWIKGEFDEIPTGLEDRTKETQEIKRQEAVIKPEYKNVKGHNEAMEAIRSMGINVKNTNSR